MATFFYKDLPNGITALPGHATANALLGLGPSILPSPEPVRIMSTYFGQPLGSRTLDLKPAQSVVRILGHAAVTSQLRIPSQTPSQNNPLLKFPGKSHRPKALRVLDSWAVPRQTSPPPCAAGD